jgi:hypothetical protein
VRSCAMSMSSSSSRPYAPNPLLNSVSNSNPNYPSSPGPGPVSAGSSVNYSQYGGSAFSPPPLLGSQGQGRQQSSMSVSSSRMNGSGGGGNLRPPGGGGSSSAGGSATARVESRDVARVHYKALKDFLAAWLDKGECQGRSIPARTAVRPDDQNPLRPELQREKSSHA